MAKFIIEGGRSLQGDIFIAGNKNAALPIIAATVLTDDVCTLENVPKIRDVTAMLDLLRFLGKRIEKTNENTYTISGSVEKSTLDDKLAGSLRASILFMGVLLARTGRAEMSPPGGCVIGRRNIDSHFEAMAALGTEIITEEKKYIASLRVPKPADLFLKEASVTATENALLLAAGIEGETIIRNAACEPHIVDLANVLAKMGAQLKGTGTNMISISGRAKLAGINHCVVPDHIEAGTFAIAAACTNGDIKIHNVERSHLILTEYYLRQMNVEIKYMDENIWRIMPSRLKSRVNKIQVGIWPGFPTDLMSPMIVLATQSEGITLCHDWMYESRMFFVDKLIAMGAQITQCDPHRVLVAGPTQLRGQHLSSPDIRAGIALMIAAMAAGGVSEIDKAELIDRGYENIADRLNKIGAKIERIE